MARHAQSSQNNIFTVSFQYLKKEVKREVYCLHADKRRSFLQVNTFIFVGRDIFEKNAGVQ